MIGLPTITAFIGILVNVGYFVSMNSRFQSTDSRLASLESRLDTRIGSLETKIDTKIDLLVGKVIELDNRIIRLEERLKH